MGYVRFVGIFDYWRKSTIVIKKHDNRFPFCSIHNLIKHTQSRRKSNLKKKKEEEEIMIRFHVPSEMGNSD